MTDPATATEQKTVELAPPVVEFKNVTKTFNPGKRSEYTAIKNVTFRVEDLPKIGEFITVVGPSGCGKSTILRLIAGLSPHFPPTTGEVLVKGKPVEGPSADRGMVFQSYTSFDHRTVLDNIAFGLECQRLGGQDRQSLGQPDSKLKTPPKKPLNKKERHDLAKQWIEKVGLSIKEDADKFPHELSGGMRQRVAIARTLILKPRILMMDEPFGALDPITRLHMQDLLINLWREVEATVFFVTHDITEAVYLGDRCYVFSSAPGTIIKEMRLPRPEKPAAQMQREPEFQKVVYELRDIIEKLEEGKD